MRLFLAVWPDQATLDLLADLPRPDRPGVRWTRPEQWHVTLRFFGQADPAAVAARVAPALVPPGRTEAEVGPASAMLGRGVLCLPVAGLGPLADLVGSVSADIGQPPRPGPFRGHLTLARGRSPSDLRALAGHPASSRWTVAELTLVSSVTDRSGSRYTVLERWALGAGGEPPGVVRKKWLS